MGLIAGLVAGYVLGDQEPDPRLLVGEVRADLRGAAALLEVVQVEYEEAVRGAEVVSEQEYGGARAALRRSRARYEQAGGVLRSLRHDAAAEIESSYAELDRLVQEPATPAEVATRIDRLVARLEQVAGTG